MSQPINGQNERSINTKSKHARFSLRSPHSRDDDTHGRNRNHQDELETFFDRVMRFRSPKKRDLARGMSETAGSKHSSWEDKIPVFGNMERYGIDTDKQFMLWEVEVKWLCRFENKPTAESLLSLVHTTEALMRSAMHKEALDRLRVLADTVLDSVHICLIDDEKELQSDLSSRGKACYRALCRRVDELDIPDRNQEREPEVQVQTAPVKGATNSSGVTIVRRHKSASSEHACEPDKPVDHEPLDESTDEEEPSAPKLYRGSSGTLNRAEPSEDERVSSIPGLTSETRLKIMPYYYLIDQITATLAYLSVSLIRNEYWHMLVLACLASISAKLKILVPNQPENIRNCLNQARPSEKKDPKRSMDDEVEEWFFLDDDSDTVERYRQEFHGVSMWLMECFISALTGLGAQQSQKMKSNDVDVTALVYPAGLRNAPTLLSQDRRRALSGTTGDVPILFSLKALRLVRGLSEALPPLHDSSGGQVRWPQIGFGHLPERSSDTICKFKMEEVKLDNKQDSKASLCIRLLDISQFVTLCIPLAVAAPKLGDLFERTLQPISALSAFDMPSPTSSSDDTIYAFASLELTPKEENHAIKLGSTALDSGGLRICSLAQKGHWLMDFNDEAHRPASQTVSSTLSSVQAHRQKLIKASEDWQIGEKSIVIQHKGPVLFVTVVSAIVVIGGFACAFLVGEKVPGVDPFNFTMFSWIIGGFIILIFKSLRVSEWTWRDFLDMRVTCRTVQEVADVSRLEPQEVLMILLSSGIYSTLRTSGPFRATFPRFQDDSDDGFSIDVKPTLETLLTTGIIPVTVKRLGGPAILLLRLVPGSHSFKSVDKAGRLMTVGHCIDPPRSKESTNKRTQHSKKQDDVVLVWDDVSWVDVLGLFNLSGAEFR